ncbi:MAG: hypothetical protein M5R42_13025 [Rhodocyclaceae bacterium]|nr:hypothetical protein [Rhodocyclaceae bacterium]
MLTSPRSRCFGASARCSHSPWRRARPAGCWANLLWLGGASVLAVVPWWAGFLVLTIAGERLELSHFLPPSPVAQRVFVAVLAGLTFGMIFQAQVFGAALLALALWLLRQDIPRRTVKDKGLTRFIAVCLLSGYAWLALAGGIMLARGWRRAVWRYDAALHALMLGFVFSMVFGHAPIIFLPCCVTVPYHPVFYVPLALLHLSLAVRLAGDATALHGVAQRRRRAQRAGAAGLHPEHDCRRDPRPLEN